MQFARGVGGRAVPDAAAPGGVLNLPWVDPRWYGTLTPNSAPAAATNTATINAAIVAANAASVALTGPVEVLMPAGLYYIAGTIAVLSGVTIRGAGMGKTTLYMPAASFTNTVMGAHGVTSVAIECAGEVVSDYTPAENISLQDFTIESEISDGRCLYPVWFRNVHQGNVRRVEIFGVPTGSLIMLDSVIGGEITGCFFHDCTTAVDTYTGAAQTTAIQTDDNRVNLVACKGLHIHNNTIVDIDMSGDALPSQNMQTDGIQLGQAVDPPQHGHNIHDNYIRNVGEGIDCFSSECNIHGNELVDCYNVGVKLIHGARRNHVHGNTIMRPGLAGLYLAGSDYNNDDVTGAVEYNYLHDNLIEDVDANEVWTGLDTAGIRIDVSTQAFKPNKNTLRGNRITGGTSTMVYAIQQDDGSSNTYIDNEAEGYTTAYSNVDAGTATIQNAKKTLVRAHVGSTQSTSASTEVTVDYDTEELDVTSEFDTTTNVFTSNSHRRIRVHAQVHLDANARLIIKIRKNSSQRAQYDLTDSTVETETAVVTDTFMVAPGDTVDVRFVQGSGSRDIVAGSTESYLVIEDVGPWSG